MKNEKKKFVVGVLGDNGKYLAEIRHDHEKYFPGKTIFPGGLIEVGESPEQALKREMKEELDIAVQEFNFIGEFYYPDGTSSLAYLVTKWQGKTKPLEAKDLVWIENESQFSTEVDINILRKIKENRGR